MKRIANILLVFLSLSAAGQTVRVRINAECVAYSPVRQKAFVAVRNTDSLYANQLLQVNPYDGTVERQLALEGEPLGLEFTPDHAHLYLTFRSLPKILKVSLATLLVESVIETGSCTVLDLAVMPGTGNDLLVSHGEGGSARNVAMYRNSVLQPRQFSPAYNAPSSLCISPGGGRLFGHNGLSTFSEGYLFGIAADGVVFDGVTWDQMVGSFGDLQVNGNLVFSATGTVVDAFSDSIPFLHAVMPVGLISEGPVRAAFSAIHGCYIFGHSYHDGSNLLSFFDGTAYNYLGSADLGVEHYGISDMDVVDQDHFIVVIWDYWKSRNEILFYRPGRERSVLRGGGEWNADRLHGENGENAEGHGGMIPGMQGEEE